MKKSNRRIAKRLKIDRSVKILVHLFPVMPFIGEATYANLINISKGGLALVVDEPVKRGAALKVHFHLPGNPIQSSSAVVTHSFVGKDGRYVLGVKFVKPPKMLVENIEKMVLNSNSCDQRIRELADPQCDKACAFFQLCRKPIRLPHYSNQSHQLELTFQNLDDTLAA